MFFNSKVKLLRLLAPSMRGKQRLAHFLLHNEIKSKHNENFHILDKWGFKFRLKGLNDPIQFSLLISGCYEPDLLWFLERELDRGDTFVDLGANIGAITLPASKFVGSDGCVLSIEASPTIVKKLQYHVIENAVKNVQVIHRAVFDKDDLMLDFYEAPASHAGMGSFGKQFGNLPIQVKTSKLDTIISGLNNPRIKLIKADIEGAEAGAFRGAKNNLSQPNAPIIVFEFCDWAEKRMGERLGASQETLLNYGYQIWKLEDYLTNKPPLKRIVTTGFYTFVAKK